MKNKIIREFQESASVKQEFVDKNVETIIEVSKVMAHAFSAGGKILLFGNGGSATDASHIAAEFVNRFKRERPAFPAISLSTDLAVITSIANDYDFSDIFARQIKALGQEGDVAVAISTSGASPNVIKGLEAARRKKMKTIVLTGTKGGKLGSKADHVFIVPSQNTPRIQETHITLGHVLCQMVEEILFESHRKG